MSNPPLQLDSAETLADLRTYVARARTLEDDGAVRLQASGTALATWVGVLKGRGMTGAGTVLGLRVLGLAEPAEVDEVVELRAVSDRLARMDSEHLRLAVPPVQVRTSWAAVSPPRRGWQPVGEVAVDVLRQAARDGIAEVTEGAPEGSRAAAVEQLRQRVWSRALPLHGGADGLPAGVALGGHALGFLEGESAQVLTNGRWFRVSTAAGHVLCH